MAVFTVGHGARPIEEFIDILDGSRIDLVVDVRRYPASKRHPHFARDALADALAKHDIAYEWRGEVLGGRRREEPGAAERHPELRVASFRAYADHTSSPEFIAAIEHLIHEGATRNLTVMCAETVWWKCHRRLISDAITLRGTAVTHLIDRGPGRIHGAEPSARLADGGGVLYDSGAARLL